MLNRYQAVFASLQRHDVRYVVIGGIAAVLHGVPRATFDLDILIQSTRENAQRLLEALEEAGLGTALLTTPESVTEQEITVFLDRVRIDVQTSTPGLDFDAAWDRRNEVVFDGQAMQVVALEDLISSKSASGRPVDLEDVRILRSLFEPDHGKQT